MDENDKKMDENGNVLLEYQCKNDKCDKLREYSELCKSCYNKEHRNKKMDENVNVLIE